MNTCTQVGGIIVDRGIHTAVATLAAIVAVATVGTVKPHLELVRAILCQLLTLLQEHLCHVGILTVVCRVSVPWRDVEAILHAVLAACLGIQLRDVCLAAVLATCLGDVVSSGSCGP